MVKSITVPKTHIILGITELDRSKFNPIINDYLKPRGGLWAAPYISDDEYVSSWHEWCIGEEFDCGLSNDSVIINLKDDAKIFIVDNCKDLLNLVSVAGEYKRHEIPSQFYRLIDFETIAQQFDGVYLTENGQCETRWINEDCAFNLYGWDCESILITNFDCIESWEYKRLDIIAEKQESAF